MNVFSDFLNGADFERHVQETILQYQKALCAIDLKKFNSNIIDPIKLTFDRAVFQKSMQQLIEDEISRQRDKTATNVIGYFHQNIFRYFPNCVVPREGWDVIVTQKDGTKIYVEMKNKHNTMNAASSQKTYIQMQNQIMQTPDDFCFWWKPLLLVLGIFRGVAVSIKRIVNMHISVGFLWISFMRLLLAKQLLFLKCVCSCREQLKRL